MSDQPLSSAIDALQAEELRLASDVEGREADLREAKAALKRVRSALASLTGSAMPSGSGQGVTADDLLPIVTGLLREAPDAPDDELRRLCEERARELGKTLRGFRTSFKKALRVIRDSDKGKGSA